MADAVSTQTLVDDEHNVVMKFTNVSDSTGESAVTKVDVSALYGAPGLVKVCKIIYSTSGMSVNLLWDATTDNVMFTLPADQSGEICFEEFGGLVNPKSSGYTGDIKLTTVGHSSGDTYTIILCMVKKR